MKIAVSDIRKLVPSRIYDRGVRYYRDGRVHLLETERDYFKAMVYGTDDYIVEVYEEEDGSFYAECDCPYFFDCKHIVAAMLAAKDYYDRLSLEKGEDIPADWKRYLAQISHEQRTQHPTKPKWQLLYTIELGHTSWSIQPQKAFIRKDGMLGALRNLSYSDFPDSNIVHSTNDSLAVSFLEKWENTRREYHLYNYDRWRTSVRFQYGAKVGVLLSLLKDSLVFFLRHAALGPPISFADQKARIEFRLTEEEKKAHLLPYLNFKGEEVLIDDKFRVLSSDPVWLLKQDLLIEIERMNNAASLVPFTQRNYDVSIPKEEVPQFLNAITSQIDLFENFRLPEGARTETISEITEKRLYLEEVEEGVQIKLRFCYGNVEVDLNDARRQLWGNTTEENSFVKVIRDANQEAEALQFLLGTSVKLNHDGRIITRKNKTLDWLVEETPKLIASGYVIYGEEKLKRYKVNRSTAQVRVAVESGIDWFDLNMEIDFGGILLSLKELKKALKQKSRYVKLTDGSAARLPKEWLNRFRHVLNLSEEQEGRLKISQFHVTLIDELFAEASQKTFDELYQKALNRLKNFEGIKDVEVPTTLRGTLRPYQKAGYHWLHFLKEFNFGGCLADDMGLGKTIQALSLLLYEGQNGADSPSLVVTPTSVVFNWIKEIERFAPSLRVLDHTGVDRMRTVKKFDGYDIILTSYGTLRRDILFLKDMQFNYVILDESQYIKNPISQTAKAARLLKAKHRLVLTGTPVENNTLELWSQFAFLNPGLLGNLNYFKSAFAKPIEQNRDAETANLLRRMIYPFVLRRTKDEVEKDLPPKVENIVYCEMSPQQEKLYNQWRDYYRAALLKQIAEVGFDKSRMNVLEGLMKLRQIACHPILVEKSFPAPVGKYETLLEYLDELLAEGHKVLLFSQFVKMLTIIRRYLDSARITYEYLDGSTRNRKSCVERFQKDDGCKIFLISLRAGGTGLNLTAADYVIHYDPWWNPAVETQATDRTHRIGQEKHVFVYKMISKGTVEEKILQLQERKKELVSNLITTDAGLFKHLTVEDIKVLFS